MQHPGFLKTIEETVDWLETANIKNYSIHEDTLVVDVHGDVDLSETPHIKHYIPIQFGEVDGTFAVSGVGEKKNEKLKSLKGSPHTITEDFLCSKNFLRNLVGGPKKVGGNYNVNSNKLTSLEGAPEEIGGHFNCSFNITLSNIQGIPKALAVNLAYCQIIDLSPITYHLESENIECQENFILKVPNNVRASKCLLYSEGLEFADISNKAKDMLVKIKERKYGKYIIDNMENMMEEIKRIDPTFHKALLKFNASSFYERQEKFGGQEEIDL